MSWWCPKRLAKQGVPTSAVPDETHWLAFAVHIAGHPRAVVVEEIMLGVLRNSERNRQGSAPAIALKAIDAMAIEVELAVLRGEPGDRMPAKNEVIDLVYRGCKANGLSLAMPPESLALGASRCGWRACSNLTPLSSR